MHFEVLVEDRSGGITVDGLLDKIFGTNGASHSWNVRPYQGIGRLPKDLRESSGRGKRLLLNLLPRLLRGYGRSLRPSSAVVVVVDLDDRDCVAFKQELLDVLEACNPCPRTLFRIAIEESEAWLLGDREAVKAAYPHANAAVLDRYEQDSICGTWEVLANVAHPGGAVVLRAAGYPETGRVKCEWARRITPHMDVDRNRSKSFQVFRDGVRSLAGMEPQA